MMPRKPCLACDRPSIARGLCGKHYKRYQVEGFPGLAAWLPTADVMPRPLRREPHPSRRCLVCSEDFTPGRSTQVICRDPGCVAQRKRDLANETTRGRQPLGDVDRVCMVCESPFKGHVNSLVCGRSCRLARNNELERRLKGSVQPACIACGVLLPFQGGTSFTCPGPCREIARKRRSRRCYVKNPGRRERMVEARRARKETDPEFAAKLSEDDRRRSREKAREAFDIEFLALRSKLEQREEKMDE